MSPAVLAIDGPAGSGKSTTARAVAARLGLAHLDSGALYRALTLAVLDAGGPVTAAHILSLAHALPIRLTLAGEAFRSEIAGVDASGQLRQERVTGRVSEVAALPEVRQWVNRELRQAAARHPRGVVADGRDIGSVVFPDAGLKVLLTATVRERARRRARQVGCDRDGSDADHLDRVERALIERDRRDSTRSIAPLPRGAADLAPGTVVLDTTGLSFEAQVEAIVRLARKSFTELDMPPSLP